MNGAQYIIEFLEGNGVETVFAYPGANVLPLYTALCQSSIRVVLTRHEQGAVYAAVGYAKSSGRVGVCIATSGPGAANLITGIADAYLDSAPLLVITGQVGADMVGRDAFQEADIMGMTIPITKHNYLIRHSDELSASLNEAWRIAEAPRSGPVLADITRDVLTNEISDISHLHSVILPRKREFPNNADTSLAQVLQAFERAYRPLLLIGGGVVSAGASAPLADAANRLNLPVAVTMMGRGADCDEFDGMLGMTGIAGSTPANEAMAQCDLLLAVGCRFSDRTVPDFYALSRGRFVIHCDIDPAELQKNVISDIPIVADARETAVLLSSVADSLAAHKCADFAEWRRGLTDKFKVGDAPALFRALSSCLMDGAVAVSDVGTVLTDLALYLTPPRERSFIASCGLGAMGFALPAAIGTAYARRDVAHIIAVTGDGGFQMTMNELPLLQRIKKELGTVIKVVIRNNYSLKMVEDIDSRGNYSFGDNPDFRNIAEAYSLEYRQISEDSGEDSFRALLSLDAPTVIELNASPDKGRKNA